jgi:hypothetical protein
MKFRYVIERSIDVVTGDEGYALSEATPNDPSYRVGYGTYTEEQAKAQAEQAAASFMDVKETPLVWKDPPQAWGPDVLCVSQYLDDGVEENRDD